MKKSDKGKKVFGLIVILAIIVSLFGGAVSAEDVSGVTQSVTDAEIETEEDNLSSEELTEALEEDPLHQLPSTSGKAHYAVADGYAWSGGTENPSGAISTGDKLRVGFSTASGNYRTLIKFDLSSIPAGATITSADLKLYYYAYAGTVGDPLDISVYRTTVDWNEGYLSWSNAENYNSFSYDTVTIIVGSGADYKTWDITALVQNWVDGTYSNYGVLLRAPTQSGSSIYRTFRSKEYGSNVPKLEVTYSEIPIPVITGINPAEPVASPTRQWISILGTGFVSESTVTLRIGSETYPIPADRTDFRSSTEIRVYVGLTDPGTWSAQVTNPGSRLSNIFSFTVIPPNQVTAAIDQQLLDLIDQYAGSYYNSGWNLNIDQYKAWIATIAWAEGGKGGYVAHSQYGGGYYGDRFDHRAVGSDFRFSTGIGPFQLDRGSTENWEFWPTIDKLDPEKAVKSVLRLHYNTFGAGADLEYLAENSRWYAVNPNYGGDPAGHWNAVTGTNWNYHKNGKTELDWSNIKDQLAQNADNPDFLYENNVRSSGTVKWNIKESEGIQTDTEKKVIFDGYYQTWLITARGWEGTELFEYYYTYRSDENIEIWVWDNSYDPINKFRYIFVREYSTGPFPERRDGNIAGETLTSSAIVEAEPPTASASDISNQPDVMHPDTLYEVTAKYYDPDGRANLDLCTLRLSRPSDSIMMGWGEDLKVPVETSEFINDGDLAVDYTPITDSYEGYRLTWKFKLNYRWPEAENCIDFCVLARDDDGLQSELDCDNTGASFVVVQPPEVTTNSATSIATSSATLNGNLDSTGGETCQVWFQYGKTTSYSDFLPSKSKSSTGPFSDVLSGLDYDTIYHFRAVASNSEGTVFGSDMTFKTDKEIGPPLVTTNAATNVEETTAPLNGVINNDGGEAGQYRVEYDTNSGEPYAYNTGWTGSKTTGQSFNAAIPSLVKGTKYYFRAQAKNSAGTASGSELTFLTKPDAPTSFSATTAGTTQIDLSWTKGAGAQKTKIQRKEGGYPIDRNDGTQVYFDTGTSTPDTGLTPGTTYYYRAWSYVQGSEQWSDSYAQDWATTTSIKAPTVTTNAATNEGTDSAQLNGYLDDMGGASSCNAWFVWDTSNHSDYNDYGYSTSPQTKSSTGSFDDSISGLVPDTTYHFRAVASNSKGTNCGSDMTFTTSEEADTTPPTWGTMIGIQSATDTGNGGEVTVTYGTATDASPPVKYNAYYSTSSPATGGTKVSNVGSSPYTVTGLTNGQLYYFSVRAEDSATPPNEDTNTFELTATPTAPDPTPPSAVTDLSTTDPTSNSIKLTWTAPGDDGDIGTATTYDVRYLEGTPIAESNWASAIQCTDETSPNPAGSAEAFVVTGLSPDTTYYFALKTADEVPNWSPISNSPSGKTEPGEVSIISIDPSSSKISAGSTTKINLALDKAPNGLSGYNLTVSLSYVTVAEIVSVSFPSWATLHDNSTLPADSIWMKAADLSDQVKSGATDINLGTLTLRGDNQGTSDIVITVTKMDDDNGYPINPNTISGQIEVTSVIPIPGHTNPPTDPDSDGLYEDLNGNGMKDFDDVVQFFKCMEWIEDNEPIACFDFNGNGLIDFADIVALFKEV